MSVKINAKELIDFKKEVEAAINKSDEILIEVVSELALRMYRLVNKLTPVDTGWLKGAWSIGAIQKNGDYYEIEISNPEEYAVFVEYGHRLVAGGMTVGWVEGRFMLTISEMEIERNKERIIKRRIENFLKGMVT